MIIVDEKMVKLEGTYKEPTTDADGQPITDLAYTSVFYQVGAEPPVRGPQVPASAPTGGGVIHTTVIVPLAVGERKTFKLWVVATDTTGLDGEPSDTVTLSLNRVAPGVPTDFTLG